MPIAPASPSVRVATVPSWFQVCAAIVVDVNYYGQKEWQEYLDYKEELLVYDEDFDYEIINEAVFRIGECRVAEVNEELMTFLENI